MPSSELARAMALPGLLFDFDGPVCDVFAGLPAPQVAHDLKELVASRQASARAEVEATDDPLVVMSLAYKADPQLGAEIERALMAAEVAAVAVAGDPTPGAVQSLQEARAAGRRVAVVSNNSAECVHAFLERHAIGHYVDHIVGRPVGQPDLMKPEPFSLHKAADLLGLQASECVMIGDSLSDIQAAHAAGTIVIGYANKPRKRPAFVEAGADCIVDGMAEIASALRL
ncbi:HAD family hydrolase [Kitasatospora cineracea]